PAFDSRRARHFPFTICDFQFTSYDRPVFNLDRIAKLLCTTLVLSAAARSSAAEVKPIYKLDAADLQARLGSDPRSVLVYRDGLQSVIGYVESHPDLFPSRPDATARLWRREEKEDVWNAWQRFLDYMVALDGIEEYHKSYQRLKGTAKQDSFLIGYA